LYNLVDFGKVTPPLIDSTVFLDTQPSWYWSSNLYADTKTYAWIIYFNYGLNYYKSTSEKYYSRCVSGNKNYNSFKLNNNNITATDISTGLIWQRCTAGQNPSSCIGDGISVYNWNQAIEYCSKLTLDGRDDWRLPNVNELRSINNFRKSIDPLIDTNIFTNNKNVYWSSTTFTHNDINAYWVSIGGSINPATKTASNGIYVRCVAGP
jgi:hypothetical protein